jgi:hypothetical protein
MVACNQLLININLKLILAESKVLHCKVYSLTSNGNDSGNKEKLSSQF